MQLFRMSGMDVTMYVHVRSAYTCVCTYEQGPTVFTKGMGPPVENSVKLLPPPRPAYQLSF